MSRLTHQAEAEAITHLMRAIEIAKRATCERSKCGSVIVKDGEVIGQGWNSPPNELESERRCHIKKNKYDIKVTDKTCCVHAEQRAIMDALRRNPEKITGSTLYFIRLDEHDEPSRAGQPYCTICSKMTLDAGVSTFVLWHEDGVYAYDAAEYNRLSFDYQG